MISQIKGNGSTVDLLELKDIESNSNYLKLPDGTLIVYGIRSSEFNNESDKIVEINFPAGIKFKDTNYVVNAMSITQDERYTFKFGFLANTSTSFNLFIDTEVAVSGNRRVGYIVIGRWK